MEEMLSKMQDALLNASRGLKQEQAIKGRSDEAILELERRLTEQLADYQFGIIQGDETDTFDSLYTWHVQSMDNKAAYLAGNPDWAMSLGLSTYGNMLASAVYLPEEDKMFIAAQGGSSFLNGKKLQSVSKSTIVDLIGTQAPPANGLYEVTNSLTRGICNVASGSYASCIADKEDPVAALILKGVGGKEKKEGEKFVYAL
ncbi:hypothetical protein H6504_05520 [Candidatus Woesearchaeota archaeon]|nr:hypothetical protein [Candidatus Woesearchaeota archaeon]